MRRSEKEITDRTEIDGIMTRALTGRLGLTDGREPYIVPVNFAWDGRSIYCHSATGGRKIELIGRNPRAAFEATADEELLRGDNACAWGMRFRSVMAVGNAVVVTDRDAVVAGLTVLMNKYGGAGPWHFREESLARTAVIRIDIERITGKRSGYPPA